MELFFIWVFIILQLVNTILASCLIHYLYTKRNQFPYANVSAVWIITFISALLLHNIFQICLVLFHFYETETKWSDYIKLFSTLYVHYVWIWPVIGRLIYITESVYYNYSFIKENLKISSYRINKIEEKRNKKFTENKNLYISKLIIFPFFTLFCIVMVMTVLGKLISHEFECYIYSFNSLIYVVTENCTNDDSINKNVVLGLIILKYFIDFVLQSSINTLVYIVYYRFKIKNDIFLMKTEVVLLTVFWYVIDNCYHGFLLFHNDFDEILFSFSYNIFQDFAFILLYYYLTYRRSKIDSKDFYVVLHNFEMFMQNPIYFNYFREYIQKFHEEEEGCLIFWRRCHHYKSYFKNNNLVDNINEAYSIFSDCIYDHKITSIIDKYTLKYSTTGIFETSSRKNLTVDLPIDVYERIEEIVNENFIIDEVTLFELYDDAFQMINAKLYNRYLNMFRNQKEYENLTKLICYIEFDMIDNELNNIENPNVTRLKSIAAN